MKSCFFLVGLSLIWVNAQAQSTSAPAKAAATPAATTPANPTPPKTDPKLTFLYTEGQITTEGVLNIQLMNAPLGIVFDELKFRYFKSGEMAYRARGFIKMNTSNAKINGSNNKSATIIENNKDFKLFGGFEKHQKSTGKYSTYYGAEIGFVMNSNSIMGTNTADGKTFKEDYKFNSDNTEFGYYLGGVVGLDYFFHPSFFIGTELRYGYESLSLGTVSEQVTDPNNVVTGTGNSLGTNTQLDLTYTHGIRFGFKF